MPYSDKYDFYRRILFALKIKPYSVTHLTMVTGISNHYIKSVIRELIDLQLIEFYISKTHYNSKPMVFYNTPKGIFILDKLNTFYGIYFNSPEPSYFGIHKDRG